ncbi:helix-turn-helix transcriptional regulator [Streptomyces sp. XY006]|uniref:helix-turn-helix transcriptional regulator n=1 Tax=Streptomyces sp. XY006 TaxID=2021410 RepID=UPI000B8C16CB|nr:helix-turn-helix transcriptional regulator [Streptomyces sp. XY006]OXS34479.1 transcriptional regulator [Streptomyces sp. XY006]
MDHLVTLGEFLRAARARLDPADVGFPATARRRVAGLRREELAQLAGVSVDYYTRLEQGRSRTASRAVLDSLASALHLDDAERVHLFDLTAQPERVHRPASAPRQWVTPAVEQLLARLDTAYCPAFVLGRRTDVLAGNRLATALITDFAALPQHERNQARFVFLDPYARELYADWEGVAADTAAMLRMDAGRHGTDPELSELVGELSRQSPVFRRMWADQRVIERTEGTKGYHHPVVGDLTITYQAMSVAGEEDQTLFVYTAADGTADETALRLLATWASSTTPRAVARSPLGREPDGKGPGQKRDVTP